MGLFGKLFGRRALVVPPPEPTFVRPEPEPDFEEDWDWKIAYARHRPKTEPVARLAVIMQAQQPPRAAIPVIPLPSMQPRTVIPVPSLPVAHDPSQVRVRLDTRQPALPLPRHQRFARGTDRHDTQPISLVRSRPQPPPIPIQAKRPRDTTFASEAATLTYASRSGGRR